MRIKLDKILIHAVLEIFMLNKSMSPLGIFVTYSTHLSLSSCCIENWASLKRAFTLLQTLLSVIYLLAHINLNPQKLLL
jgi:hypothetical protein